MTFRDQTLVATMLCITMMTADAEVWVKGQQSDSRRWLAIHRQEEKQWAKKNHLTVSEVRAILKAADVKGTEDFYVENLDAHTLRTRNQVLLSTWESGTGKCLAVHILQRGKKGFKEIWSEARAGEDNFCSPGVCGGANTYITLRNIIVQVPLDCNALFDEADPMAEVDVRCVRFSWNGRGYELADTKEKSIPVVQYKKEARHCSQ